MKILLVDDRPENLLALESILGSLGHELVTASSGEQALRAVLREEFAVILLDVRMPGMDGFEVASHIRLRERSRDTPIIFLTAAGDGPHQTLRGYAAGAADYLTKPFDPWVLRAKVGVFAELHRKNRQLKEQAEMLRESAGVTPKMLEELSERLGAIEGTLALLIDQSGREGPVGRLERRVVHMRAALDAVLM
ncbi:MAG: response regulator [Catenulispora sp.]|nr:response regulator [Catenulispora sp.]